MKTIDNRLISDKNIASFSISHHRYCEFYKWMCFIHTKKGAFMGEGKTKREAVCMALEKFRLVNELY